MKNYLEMDCTPLDEPCLNVGGDTEMQKIEAHAMRDQIERVFSPYPDGFYIKLNRNHHDFGIYYDLQLWFQESITEEETPSEKFTFMLETSWPTVWDETARKELQSKGYFDALKNQKKPNVQQFAGSWLIKHHKLNY